MGRRKLTETDDNSRRRGRPKTNVPLKRWQDYVDAVCETHPGRGLGGLQLFTFIRREHPSAAHSTIDSFYKVMNGTMPARLGFDTALAKALRLEEIGSGPDDFDLAPDSFKTKLKGERPLSLTESLAQGRDGTKLLLYPRADPRTRHFGAGTGSAPMVLDAGTSYSLSIVRAATASGVDGPLLLLGYGYGDRQWQFVSAVADSPITPITRIQWGRMTSISLTPDYQPGKFTLFAVGAKRPFSTALTSLFCQHREIRGFFSNLELTALENAVREAISHGAWVASLDYVLRG